MHPLLFSLWLTIDSTHGVAPRQGTCTVWIVRVMTDRRCFYGYLIGLLWPPRESLRLGGHGKAQRRAFWLVGASYNNDGHVAQQPTHVKPNGASFHAIEVVGGSLGAVPVTTVHSGVSTMVADVTDLRQAHCYGDCKGRVGPRANQLHSCACEGGADVIGPSLPHEVARIGGNASSMAVPWCAATPTTQMCLASLPAP